MPAHKSLPWTRQELAILDELYPAKGLQGVLDALSDRSWHAIAVQANKRGLKSPVITDAPKAKLQGARLEEAIRLREEERWSFARIGAHLGVCEAAANNAVIAALCVRRGYTPAQRDEKGRLTPEGLERLRLALRKGMKGVEIQLRLGLSAGRIAEERRRYSADLKARGKAPLPPPGGGEAYSGARISKEKRRLVEQLLLEGYGAQKVTEKAGVSRTHVGRARNRLIRKLGRRGECLPGCDSKGRRIKQIDSARFIPDEAVAELRRRLLEREPCRRAALELGIGSCSAYRIRAALVAELAAEGKALPKAVWHSRSKDTQRQARAADWLPEGKLFRYRELCRTHGLAEAKTLMLAEIEAERLAEADRRRAEAARKPTFQEQLERARRGAQLVTVVPLRRPDPTMTLGGVATGAL